MQMDQDDDDDEGNEPFQEPDLQDIPEEPEEEPPRKVRSKHAKEKAWEEEPDDVVPPTFDVRNDVSEEEPEEQMIEPEPSLKKNKGKGKVLQDESNTTAERPRKRSKKENRRE